jgi:S-phase kinase-associated protein 1
MEAPQTEQQVTLESSDEVQIKVSKSVACMSVTIKNMLEDMQDMEANVPIPLPNVNGKTLDKVLQYCKHHENDAPVAPADVKPDNKSTDLAPWDAAFIKIDQASLFDLILAANYLDIKPLLDVGCKSVANMIKGKQPEEIRQLFNIKNGMYFRDVWCVFDHSLFVDFTKEEEEQVRKENEWCEEK